VKVEFLEPARQEFEDAIAYYDRQEFGLGLRFKHEIQISIDMIRKFPKLYPIQKNDIRKCVSRTFPYTVFYRYEEETIYIYAVANHHRNLHVYSKRFHTHP